MFNRALMFVTAVCSVTAAVPLAFAPNADDIARRHMANNQTTRENIPNKVVLVPGAKR
ncbi:hypothetical protein QCA50_016152 [Cerrena zonata]|uniref:Uncharacterized protein n=1 Tax=Cerrena zonata TaxID=2478898 RepID=A0AAW0FL07_9APHY